jgi:hypothetical protein
VRLEGGADGLSGLEVGVCGDEVGHRLGEAGLGLGVFGRVGCGASVGKKV